MMLESSLSDLREAQGVTLPFCPSLVRLLRLLQDFLFAEGTDNQALWSEKVHNINGKWYLFKTVKNHPPLTVRSSWVTKILVLKSGSFILQTPSRMRFNRP